MSLVWYAGVTAPQKEFVAERVLKSLGVECFVPSRREWRRPNRYVGIKRGVHYPVVPRYVFLCVEDANWKPVFQTGYVRGVLSRNGEPLEISSGDLDKLRKMGRTAPGAHRWMRTHREFQVGEYVRLVEGPFKDWEFQVLAIDEATGKAKIDADILGAKRSMVVDIEQAEKAA